MAKGTSTSLAARAGRRALRTGRRLVRPAPRTRHTLVGPAELWARKRDFQFEFLTSHGLRPAHRLLDIGCGTLRGGIPLIEYLEAGNYVGIEARAPVLEEARKELAESGLEHKRPVLIHASDPAQIQLETRFDFAWAFSVLVHMRDEVVSGYLALVSEALGEGGKLYASVMLGEHPEAQWQGFPVISRPQASYERWAASCGLSMENLGELGTLGHRMGQGDRGMMLCFSAQPTTPR